MATRGKTIGKVIGEGLAVLMEDLPDDEKFNYDHLANKPLTDAEVARVKRIPEDFTTLTPAQANKLAGIPENVVPNVKPDWHASPGTDQEVLNKPHIPTAAEIFTDIRDNIQNVVEERFTAVKVARSYESNQESLTTSKVSVTDDSIVLSQNTDVPTSYLDIRNTIGFRIRVVGASSNARRTGPITGISRYGSGGFIYMIDDQNNKVLVYDTDFIRHRDREFTVDSGFYVGGFVYNNMFYTVPGGGTPHRATLKAYDFEGTRQSNHDISCVWSASNAQPIHDVFVTSNRIYLVGHHSSSRGRALAFSFEGQTKPTEDIIMPSLYAGVVTDNRIFLVNSSRQVRSYDLTTRARQSEEDFILDSTLVSRADTMFFMNGLIYVVDDTKDRAIPYEPVTRLVQPSDKYLELTNVRHTGGLFAHGDTYHTIESTFTESTGTFQAGENIDIAFEYPTPLTRVR